MTPALQTAYEAVQRSTDGLREAAPAGRAAAFRTRAQAWRMLSDQLEVRTLADTVLFRAVVSAEQYDLDRAELADIAVTTYDDAR